VIASSRGPSSARAAAQVPVSVAGERSAPCRAKAVTSEFWERPATYRSVSRCAMNALETRPLPIAFGGPGAVTVAGTRHGQARPYRARARAPPPDPQPVQHLGDVIPQPTERRAALRTAVLAAGEVPHHLHPRQVRIIPPARPRPRPPLPALPAASGPNLTPAVTAPDGCLGPGPFRGPAEQHPLQHRQLGVHPFQLPA